MVTQVHSLSEPADLYSQNGHASFPESHTKKKKIKWTLKKKDDRGRPKRCKVCLKSAVAWFFNIPQGPWSERFGW